MKQPPDAQIHSLLTFIEVRAAQACNEKPATVVFEKAIFDSVGVDGIDPLEYASITYPHAVSQVGNERLF